jgi:hypothetical protein
VSLIKEPIRRAEQVTTLLQASRLHQAIEAEIALNDALPPDWEADATRALVILEAKFDVTALRDPVVAAGKRGEWFPGLSRDAAAGLGGDDVGGEAVATAPTTDWAWVFYQLIEGTRWKPVFGGLSLLVLIVMVAVGVLVIGVAVLAIIAEVVHLITMPVS